MKPALSVALIALVSCTHGGLAPPERGGSQWLSIRTRHFDLRTDLQPEEARAQAASLEEAYAVQQQLLRTPEPLSKLVVVATRNERELLYFNRKPELRVSGGLFFGEEVILVNGGQGPLRNNISLREYLASDALIRLLPHPPLWLRVGFPLFMDGTVAKDGAVFYGTPLVEVLPYAKRGLTPTSWLLTYGRKGKDAGDLWNPVPRASAWFLTHEMILRHGDVLANYLDRLRAGEAQAEAFTHAAGALTPERLDEELRQSLANPTLAMLRRPEPTAESEFEPARPLSVAETHGLFLQIQRISNYWIGYSGQKIETDAILKNDPLDPIGLALAGQLTPSERLERIRASTLSRPDDYREWLLFAAYQIQREEGQSLDFANDVAWTLERYAARATEGRTAPEIAGAIRRAHQLAPRDPYTNLALATVLLREGQAAQARAAAEVAYSANPWRFAITDLYASVLAATGDCARALPLERTALFWSERFAGAAVDSAIDRHLREMEKQCPTAR